MRRFTVDPWQNVVWATGADGAPLFAFGGRGSGEGQFSHPVAAAVVWPRPDGEPMSEAEPLVAIADCCNHRVQVFTLDGVFVGAFGRRGAGFVPRQWRGLPGDLPLPSPIGLAWSAPYLTVTCAGGERVAVHLASMLAPQPAVRRLECA